MLRDDLHDSDIPRRTHIRTRVAEIWDEHIAKLEHEMAVCSSLIIVLLILTFSVVVSWQNLDNHGPLD